MFIRIVCLCKNLFSLFCNIGWSGCTVQYWRVWIWTSISNFAAIRHYIALAQDDWNSLLMMVTDTTLSSPQCFKSCCVMYLIGCLDQCVGWNKYWSINWSIPLQCHLVPITRYHLMTAYYLSSSRLEHCPLLPHFSLLHETACQHRPCLTA